MGNGRGLSLQFPNENVRRNTLVPSGPWSPWESSAQESWDQRHRIHRRHVRNHGPIPHLKGRTLEAHRDVWLVQGDSPGQHLDPRPLNSQRPFTAPLPRLSGRLRRSPGSCQSLCSAHTLAPPPSPSLGIPHTDRNQYRPMANGLPCTAGSCTRLPADPQQRERRGKLLDSSCCQSAS